MIKIPQQEFAARVDRLKAWMEREGIDACFVYGDEYRRENLRYLSNVWPLFERGALVVPRAGDPIVLGAPEGEMLAREMTAWQDIRLVADFTCVTVPDEIEYPLAQYTTLADVLEEARGRSGLRRLGVVGLDAMSPALLDNIRQSSAGAEIVDANDALFALRIQKTPAEVACLREAARIADVAYAALLRAVAPGVTELQLAGTAIAAAMAEGAEYVPFILVSSGERVNTIIGRATSKPLVQGEMVMAALAVQYEGYIASFNFPFVVGKPTAEQVQLIDWLIGAYEAGLPHLRAGAVQGQLVKAVKDYFAANGLSQYDLYPPLHGCGVSEAESPYPNEHVTALFEQNMTVNTDISIFGHPYGSNRIESSFVVTRDGCEPLSDLIGRLIRLWKETRSYQGAL